jgi:rod shape-determining protein MreD
MGVHVLSKLVVGFVAGMFEQSIYADDPFLPAVATFLATILGELVLMAVLVITGLAPLVWPRALQAPLAQAVLNSAIAPFVFRGVRAIEHQIQRQEQGS